MKKKLIQQLRHKAIVFLQNVGRWWSPVNIPGRCAGQVELESAVGPVWRRWNVSRSILRARQRRDAPRAAACQDYVMRNRPRAVAACLQRRLLNIWAADGRGLRLNPISAATPTARLHKSVSCRRSTVSQLSAETQNKSGNCLGGGRKIQAKWESFGYLHSGDFEWHWVIAAFPFSHRR